jgi:hypothetical protein
MPTNANEQAKAYPFTPAEFERLYAFRQAVLAGFYTDELSDETVAESETSEHRDTSSVA